MVFPVKREPHPRKSCSCLTSCLNTIRHPLKELTMKTHLMKPKYIFTLVIVLLVVMSVLGVNPIRRAIRRTQQQQERRPVTDTLPPIISKAKNIEVVSATIKRQGDPTAVVVIVLRNNSDRAVVAISIESGDERDASGISTEGFRNGDEPSIVVLEPHGTITMEMPLSDLLPGKPLKVAGVMYADGSEDG